MLSQIQLSAVVFIAAVIWGILLVIDGVAVSLTWLRPLSTVSGALVLVLGAFDWWLWQLPILHGWFVKRPNLNGTWSGVIRSNWVDPSTGKTTDPIESYMVIRQTFSSLSLRLLTQESFSELLGAEILRNSDDGFRVSGIYRSEPRQAVRYKSPIHHGAFLIQVVGTPATGFKGHYWTDRNTAGEMEFVDHRSQLVVDFESATRLFGKQTGD